MAVVYLNPPYPDLSLERELLTRAGLELVSCAVRSESETIEAAKEADAVLTVQDPISARVAHGLRRCKVVVRLGVGYDVVDVPACRECGILVCNVPDYGTEEVANHAHALFFALHRQLFSYDRNVRNGAWGHLLPRPIRRLSTLRVGVLGLGRIGTAFARGIQPFVRDVVAFDPLLTPDQYLAKGIPAGTLQEILETADVISLHLPLTDENRHLIGNAAIAQMRRRPIVINVSRGALIDGPALGRALRSGEVAGAGLDVFEDEPHVPAEYLSLDNVVLSPHVAWYSEESNEQLRRSAAEEIVRVLSGQPPKNPVG